MDMDRETFGKSKWTSIVNNLLCGTSVASNTLETFFSLQAEEEEIVSFVDAFCKLILLLLLLLRNHDLAHKGPVKMIRRVPCSLELHSNINPYIDSLSLSFPSVKANRTLFLDFCESPPQFSLHEILHTRYSSKLSRDFEITVPTEAHVPGGREERGENWALERHARAPRATAIITLRRIMDATRSYMRRLITKFSRSPPVEQSTLIA